MLRILAFVAALLFAPAAFAQKKPPAKPLPGAQEGDQLKVLKGFKAELLYSVPKETEGSWVSLTTLPGNKLIACDQYGSLYRITPPPIGTKDGTKIEKLAIDIGAAQGLCWAFDSLYVVVNNAAKSGLYRVTASKPGGELDKVELLRKFEGHNGGGLGEHGPHAVIKHPDGKRLTVVCGNQTKITELTSSKVPKNWGEDHLLPRLPDGNGFMAGVLGPGGAIYNVSLDGKEWELFSVGFRNQYDAAYDAHGNLFTYDADMEWDYNTPWYRPTRVCQVTSGSEFGWRNGAGKYPAYYPDNLPGICDIGPGSPTGVVFGYGAKFPAKYQNALFICDWSYGKMYAVHMTPNGSVMKGTPEEFVTGTPLPLTDIVIGDDGAMYFTTGGRKTQSGLYRVTYVGTESTAKAEPAPQTTSLRGFVEPWLGNASFHALSNIPQALNSKDRFDRFSARAALEFQDVKSWADMALQYEEPNQKINALLALVRVSASCPQHDPQRKKAGDPALRAKILESLGKLDFTKLTVEQRLELIRVYHVLFNRFGPPTAEERTAWLAKYEPVYPTGQRFVDGELCQVFVYLQGPKTAEKTIKLLQEALTQEEQMEYARALRMLKDGWTPETRKAYFEWFVKAQGYKGGNSFAKFVLMMKADAEKNLNDAEKVALKPILDAKPPENVTVAGPPRPLVKKYEMAELAPLVEKGLAASGRDYDKGRKLFAAANCFACHRYDNEGGNTGPDLTGIAGRFNQRDLLESIIDPSKEVSDQYQAVVIDTLDGKKVTGRIINLNGDNIMVLTDMTNPNGITTVNRKNVDEIKPSKLSMMPEGLLNTLKEDEILDLMAYLLSRGDRNHAVFVSPKR
jgi:putative heme-binding domain-containing protein